MNQAMRPRALFVLRAAANGVAHVGEILNRNLIVGALFILALAGVTIGPALFFGLLPGVVIFAIICLLILGDGAYLEWNKAHEVVKATSASEERHVPENRTDLIKALFQLQKVSDELLSSLMMIAHIKGIYDESGKSTDHLVLNSERIQELLDTRHELALQAQIAGPDFKTILEFYQREIDLETDICRDPPEPLTMEQFQDARRKVRDTADKAIELLHEGKLYMPKPSAARKANSPQKPTS